MENSITESDVLSSPSTTEIKFLQQVKECQEHLFCMEKLFIDLKKESEGQLFATSQNSLNDFKSPTEQLQSFNYNNFSDVLQEFKTNLHNENNSFNECDNMRPCKDTPTKVVKSNNNFDTSPLTFVIQVPNSIIDIVKEKMCRNILSNCTSQCSVSNVWKKQKTTNFITKLKKLFKKEKKCIPFKLEAKISETDFNKFLEDKNKENFINNLQKLNDSNLKCESITTNSQFTEKSCINKDSTNIDIGIQTVDIMKKQITLFPITCDYNENFCKEENSNVTIHHEIIPQTSNLYSHSIKIINELPNAIQNLTATDKEKKYEETEVKVSINREQQSTEMLLEDLIQILIKIIEKINNFEKIKTLIEDLQEKKLKTEKYSEDNESTVRNCKEVKVLDHLLTYLMDSSGKKANKSKYREENEQYNLKKHLSKLSVCSSVSISSDEEFYSRPLYQDISKSRCIKKNNKRCNSPSTLTYLVCQSERDVDHKINTLY